MNQDETILDALQVPEGMDSDTLYNNILLETAELEILYPNPDFLKMAIEKWSNSRIKSWTKLWATENYEYEAIYNYDRTEEATITGKTTNTGSFNGRGTQTGQVSAYNSADFQNREKTTMESSTTNTDTGDSTTTEKRKMYGNIGVTTTQEMIQAERNIDTFSTYDVIVQEFKEKFCLLVY